MPSYGSQEYPHQLESKPAVGSRVSSRWIQSHLSQRTATRALRAYHVTKFGAPARCEVPGSVAGFTPTLCSRQNCSSQAHTSLPMVHENGTGIRDARLAAHVAGPLVRRSTHCWVSARLIHCGSGIIHQVRQLSSWRELALDSRIEGCIVGCANKHSWLFVYRLTRELVCGRISCV